MLGFIWNLELDFWFFLHFINIKNIILPIINKIEPEIYSEEKGESLKFKEVSEEELEIIKKKIHFTLKKNRKKRLVMLFISAIISILVVIWIFN